LFRNRTDHFIGSIDGLALIVLRSADIFHPTVFAWFEVVTKLSAIFVFHLLKGWPHGGPKVLKSIVKIAQDLISLCKSVSLCKVNTNKTQYQGITVGIGVGAGKFLGCEGFLPKIPQTCPKSFCATFAYKFSPT